MAGCPWLLQVLPLAKKPQVEAFQTFSDCSGTRALVFAIKISSTDFEEDIHYYSNPESASCFTAKGSLNNRCNRSQTAVAARIITGCQFLHPVSRSRLHEAFVVFGRVISCDEHPPLCINLGP
jgi:hypothetical protein